MNSIMMLALTNEQVGAVIGVYVASALAATLAVYALLSAWKSIPAVKDGCWKWGVAVTLALLAACGAYVVAPMYYGMTKHYLLMPFQENAASAPAESAPAGK